MKPPVAPPPLADLAKHKDELEVDRQARFERWKAALEAARGNVSRAASTLVGGPGAREMQRARSLAFAWTRDLGLRAYAAALRVEAGGRRGAGRPRSRKNA